MSTVQQTFRTRGVKGDLGIEIEVEGDRLPTHLAGWNVEHDGSLRTYHGMALEYIFSQPASLEQSSELMDTLLESFKASKSKVVDSPNCGVHVHVNVQDLTMTQLYNFFTLYLTFEEVLTKFCGPTREGNLFCLRAQDAEFLLVELENAARDEQFRPRFATNELRYAAMNVCSLPRYGSLEFRAMRGTTDKNTIMTWAGLLLSLREAAKRFDSPVRIAEQMSMGGEAALLLEVFGDEGRFLMDYPNWEVACMRGMRRTQDFAHAGDWRKLSQLPKRMIGGVEVTQNFEDDFPPMDV